LGIDSVETDADCEKQHYTSYLLNYFFQVEYLLINFTAGWDRQKYSNAESGSYA